MEEARVKSVYFLVLPSVHILDLAGPLQVLATVAELGIAPLEVRCISPLPSVRSFQNVQLHDVGPLPTRLREGDALIAIGSKLQNGLESSPAWLSAARWLQRIAEQDSAERLTLAAVCTGAFLLGDAGLLDGRTCTTHHSLQTRLRQHFPLANVLDNRVFVRDGPIWTSAGVASGMDLALQLVAQAFGDEAAIQVARENVVPFRRFSADPELSPQFRSRSHANQLVHAVQDAIGKDLGTTLSDPAFAKRFCISPRHLSRVFAQELGMSPKHYQLGLRIARARSLLVCSTLPVEEIALRCGFGSVQSFRTQWDKAMPLAPSAYRRQFRQRRDPVSAD